MLEKQKDRNKKKKKERKPSALQMAGESLIITGRKLDM